MGKVYKVTTIMSIKIPKNNLKNPWFTIIGVLKGGGEIILILPYNLDSLYSINLKICMQKYVDHVYFAFCVSAAN